MAPIHHVHPQWDNLLQWLASHGMVTHDLQVEPRLTPGAGYGLFATGIIQPSTPLFSIPATALMNYLTLEPHYPSSRPKLSGTQIVSMHLLLHRPLNPSSRSEDPLFGPFISVLPREVDWHPVTWLWKENLHGTGSIETQLLNTLPKPIMERLNKMFGLFEIDWKRIRDYLKEHPAVTSRRSQTRGSTNVAEWEKDYLWAWLIVNTRCIYHRLTSSRSSPDNLTLCPILDFANHTFSEKFICPKATQAERFDTRSFAKRKFGENFILLSPSTWTAQTGEQLFLRYGMHANSTLFTEYGFVNMVVWDNLPEGFQAEVELDSYVEALFERRGDLGSFMKNILLEEGYWKDWTMHTSPAPAHPSYRLITALRLYHVLRREVTKIPEASVTETQLDAWRNTTLGKQDVISEDNEQLWRACLVRICEEIIAKAGESRSKTTEHDLADWAESAQHFVEKLWEEESYVATEVIKSLRTNTTF